VAFDNFPWRCHNDVAGKKKKLPLVMIPDVKRWMGVQGLVLARSSTGKSSYGVIPGGRGHLTNCLGHLVRSGLEWTCQLPMHFTQ
jgi:hypothetical protein